MKKTLIFVSIIILLLSFTANAESILETTYASFTGLSLLDISFTAGVSENIVIKGTSSTINSIIGSFNKFDIMFGYKTKYDNKKNIFYGNADTTMALLGGIRKSQYDTGLLLGFDSKSVYDNGFFIHDLLEFVIWDADASALTSKMLIGYKIVENYAIKGGITWINSNGESAFGITAGIETIF